MVNFLTQDPTFAPHKLPPNTTTECRRARADRGTSSAQTAWIFSMVSSRATGASSISGEMCPGKIKGQKDKGRILVLSIGTRVKAGCCAWGRLLTELQEASADSVLRRI